MLANADTRLVLSSSERLWMCGTTKANDVAAGNIQTSNTCRTIDRTTILFQETPNTPGRHSLIE